MTLKKIVFYTIGVFLCLIPLIAFTMDKVEGLSPQSIQVPIPEGAIFLKETTDRELNFRNVYYKLSAAYPADSLLEFYDKEYAACKLFPYREENNEREWEQYIVMAEGGQEIIDQKIAKWSDKERTILVVVGFIYRRMATDEPREIVEVVVRVIPFEENK